MAGASQKKQAQQNQRTLKEIHTLSLIINIISILCIFLLKRPLTKKYFVIYNIPALIAQYVVEQNGRPVFDNASGKLIKAGDDLQQSGMTEYLIDLIYVTLAIDLLMCVFGSNKVWYLYLIIPVFAVYKLLAVFKAGKAMLGFGGGSGNKKTADTGSSSSSASEQTKSKRQTKLENRSKKQQVRYR